MAGIFGLFDYTKEGPGVYITDPPKGPFKLFFEILGRKFWKIVTLNIMYIVLGFPALILAWAAGTQIFPTLIPALSLESLEKIFNQALSSASEISQSASAVSDSAASISGGAQTLSPADTAAILFSQINVLLSLALVGLQLIVPGPVHAGITYIFRNFSREEHAFIWGDFKDHFAKNWKQSTVTSIISFLAILVVAVNISFYSSNDVLNSSFITGILSGGVIVIFILFTIMQMYIYPMMVTFKLSIRQLYKNSMLLSMAKLPSNIGIILISVMITLGIPALLLFALGSIAIVLIMAYYIFICFGLNLLVTNYFVYRQLKRYMIDPIKSQSSAVSDNIETDTNSVDEENPDNQ